jgi:response regulator RpfG family c-di-GMP phosphodiesterase
MSRHVSAHGAEEEMARRLAYVAEYRDDDTGEHTARVGRTAVALGEALEVGPHLIGHLELAAPLHDIGKVAIPDAILLKPGALTEPELRLVRRHTVLGAEILSGSSSEILRVACRVARSHHERWDGRGYPDGLVGERIPLAARIVAIADVFDALTQARPYKQAWPIEQAVDEIANGAGAQFDPTVARAFAALDHERLVAPAPGIDAARRRRSRMTS